MTAPLIDQGARPLCVPISLSLAHEAAVITAADQARAPEAIWWHCTKEGLVSADGMLLEDAGDTLEVSGQPALVAWPWNPNLGVGTEDPPGAAGSPPWQTATLEPLDLAHDGIESDIEDALAEGRPVVLVVEVTDEFDEAGEDGSIEVPDIRSASGDYHAVLVVGAATDAERGRRLLIRNSWGDYWGAGGYAWLPLDYLIAFAAEAAVVINWHAAL
ncbi:C1 family peptidase [Kribbella kalugense]|uniref:C1 family peptidase n=1 Tax=Kribbella kalugense TaxID=2512221 RepID=UPI0014170837|nr:C1 family peptidase [Kribbella kalugense]